MSKVGMIGIVLHRPDYRGGHSTDVEEAYFLPPDTTLADLKERAQDASTYGFAWIVIPGGKS